MSLGFSGFRAENEIVFCDQSGLTTDGTAGHGFLFLLSVRTRITVAKTFRRLRKFCSSARDEGVGRGSRRGEIQLRQTKADSSPLPSPPSDGGEGVWPRIRHVVKSVVGRSESIFHLFARIRLRCAYLFWKTNFPIH